MEGNFSVKMTSREDNLNVRQLSKTAESAENVLSSRTETIFKIIKHLKAMKAYLNICKIYLEAGKNELSLSFYSYYSH